MKAERPTVLISDDEQKFVHATWSQSGKRVIVTVGRSWDAAGQVELTPEQAADPAEFLAAGPDGNVR